MKKFLILSTLILFSSCFRKQFELEQISEDVLNAKQGVEIEIKPLPKA